MKHSLEVLRLRARALGEIFRHFENPWLVTALRFGLVRLPLFPYRIRKGACAYEVLARPSTLSLSDLFVLREVLIEETYRDVLALLPAGPLRVVDVGGNLGTFSLWLHRQRGLKAVWCFEPEPDSYALCRFNLARNGVEGAQAIAKAMGGQARTIAMPRSSGRPGGVSIYGSAGSGEEATCPVEVVALAEWLGGQPGEFDLLKLDCEGAEWEILEHTPAECFERFPVIVAEVHNDPAGRRTPDDFPRGMERLGFRTVRWDGGHMGLYLGQRAGRTAA